MMTLFLLWLNDCTPWYYIPPIYKGTFKFCIFIDILLALFITLMISQCQNH